MAAQDAGLAVDQVHVADRLGTLGNRHRRRQLLALDAAFPQAFQQLALAVLLGPLVVDPALVVEPDAVEVVEPLGADRAGRKVGRHLVGVAGQRVAVAPRASQFQ